MAPVLIAKVALENVSYHFDKAYDYCVPESLRERARPGCRVSVPFGRGNQKRFGMLFSLSEEEPSGRLKQLSCVLDEEPLLNANMLRLAVWLKAHTFCTLYEAVRTILPSGINLRHKMQYRIAPEIGDLVLDTFPSDEREVLQLLHKRQAYVGEERIMQLTGLEKGSDVFKRLLKKQLVVRNDEAAQRIGDATVRMVRLCVAGEELEQLLPSLTQKQRAVMDVLLDVGCASVKELCYFTGVTPAVVAALEKKNLIDYYENEIYRDPARQPEAEQVPQAPICLTRKQQALEQLKSVTKTQALKHPNWEMGAKITIDSASMMNKGFEVIEAKWLFGVQPSQIEVVVHPQSVIHSMVQFEDGAVKAQLGMPDMRLPIQYAFSYPDRISSSFDRLDFSQCTNLTFEQPDTKRFRNLALAYEAMYRGGNMPCIVNAANEVVVASFLKDGISFLGMSDVIEKTMERVAFIANPTYDDYVATDAEARKIAASLI